MTTISLNNQFELHEIRFDAFSRRHPNFRAFLALFLSSCLFICLMHIKSFTTKHIEGDEIVYLTLSREMNWNLTHYTTMDDPVVSHFPYSTYRHPLFIHPPLYPLILKIGDIFGQPVASGLLFANLSLGLLLLYAWRSMVLLQISPRWAVGTFLNIVFCPLLLFSTSRLHIDGLFAIWITCALVAYIEALDNSSSARALLAGMMMIIAMNIRYSGIVALPLIFLVQVYHLHLLAYQRDQSASAISPTLWNIGLKSGCWKVSAIVLGFVLTLGMQHYYRVFATFGTLLPSSIIVADPNVAAFSPFLRMISTRSWWAPFFYFVLIFPISIIFITPWPYRIALERRRKGEWAPAFLLICLALLAMTILFSRTQMRYFAAAMPALYLYLAVVLEKSSPRMQVLFIGLGTLSLWLMCTTGFLWTTVYDQSAATIPSAYLYFPFLTLLFDIQ